MGARGDKPRHRMVRIDPQRLGVLHVGGLRIAVGQHETRGPVGQRRLADALRTTDQPGVGNPAAAIGVQERSLGFAMTEQNAGLARRADRDFLFDLARTHAVAAVNKWSHSVVQTRPATLSGSGVASIRTQRCGSSAAICRYASRRALWNFRSSASNLSAARSPRRAAARLWPTSTGTSRMRVRSGLRSPMVTRCMALRTTGETLP